MEECETICEDSTKTNVIWKNRTKLPTREKLVKIRLEFENSSLFVFWVSDTIEGKSRGYLGQEDRDMTEGVICDGLKQEKIPLLGNKF